MPIKISKSRRLYGSCFYSSPSQCIFIKETRVFFLDLKKFYPKNTMVPRPGLFEHWGILINQFSTITKVAFTPTRLHIPTFIKKTTSNSNLLAGAHELFSLISRSWPNKKLSI